MISTGEFQFFGTEEKPYELEDVTKAEVGMQHVNLIMDQQELIETLSKICFELTGIAREKDDIINQMKMQIDDLKEKINISSIGFDLPEDYYESDEYLL